MIGLGLLDEKDLTLRGIEEAKKSDKVYIELYTSKWHGNLKNLEKSMGKQVIELKRSDLEENSKKILEQAKNENIVIFVQGDPMVATTHSSLILDARKSGIKTKVIHNASIISAIAESGLHIYKFGPVVTIPFLEKTKGRLPKSVYDTIKENKKRGLHTLCLLDVIGEEKGYLTVNEAIKILLDLEKENNGKIINEGTEVVVVSKIGSYTPKIVYDKIKGVINSQFDIPSILIIPYIFIAYTIWARATYKLGAPYVPSSRKAVKKMLEIAKLKPGEILYDLGSGDGRTVIGAARNYNVKAIGIEIDPIRVLLSRFLIKVFGLENRAKIIHGDFFKQNLRNADVVVVYLLQKTNDKLQKKLERELRKGTRVISHWFTFKGWKLIKADRKLKVYMYKV
ncbi:diphthine synthase [archaeon]|nr:diphthine synthase [archaeon]